MRRRRPFAFYAGPEETYRRFMAGRPITDLEYITDTSLWVIVPMSPWHHALLCAFLRPENRHHGVSVPWFDPAQRVAALMPSREERRAAAREHAADAKRFEELLAASTIGYTDARKRREPTGIEFNQSLIDDAHRYEAARAQARARLNRYGDDA